MSVLLCTHHRAVGTNRKQSPEALRLVQEEIRARKRNGESDPALKYNRRGCGLGEMRDLRCKPARGTPTLPFCSLSYVLRWSIISVKTAGSSRNLRREFERESTCDKHQKDNEAQLEAAIERKYGDTRGV